MNHLAKHGELDDILISLSSSVPLPIAIFFRPPLYTLDVDAYGIQTSREKTLDANDQGLQNKAIFSLQGLLFPFPPLFPSAAHENALLVKNNDDFGFGAIPDLTNRFFPCMVFIFSVVVINSRSIPLCLDVMRCYYSPPGAPRPSVHAL